MLGFKDGTANIKAEDKKGVDKFVWVRDGEGPDWLVGGSYLVSRKINMRIETWDRESLEGQNSIIGRVKGSGGPLSGGDEFDEIDFKAKDKDGILVTGEKSHVRLAHPHFNKGAKLLRLGYNFVDGSDGLGQLAAGLFFLAYQRNPVTQFVQVQHSLAGLQNDLLNEYIVHAGLFACPPGVGKTGYWADPLCMSRGRSRPSVNAGWCVAAMPPGAKPAELMMRRGAASRALEGRPCDSLDVILAVRSSLCRLPLRTPRLPFCPSRPHALPS